MKKIFVLLFVVLFVSSCQSPKEKLEKDLKAKLTEYVLSTKDNGDSIVKLDSLRIIRIDTITPLDDTTNILLRIVDNINYANKRMDLDSKQMGNIISQMRLYSQLGWSTLLDNSNDEFKKIKAEVDKNKPYIDALVARSRAIDSLITLNKVDSTTLIGYQVVFKLIGQKSNNKEIKIDTGYVSFSKELHIREKPKVDYEWIEN